MKEIEIEVKFENSKEEILNILSKFEYVGEKEIIDTYYYDPLRNNLKPESDLRLNETFRIRKNNDECFITYKKQHFKGKLWIYSDEYETKVMDYNVINNIISLLGLIPLITVHNKRTIFRNNNYEIMLEEVGGLGLFLEVERISKSNKSEIEVKEEIRNFIRSLKLKNVKEMNIGKNQYLLSQRLNHKINVFNNTPYN